jgi:hypothetical protein
MALDRYASAVIRLIGRRYDEWEAAPPTASDISRPRCTGPLRKVETVHGVAIAVDDEDWPSRSFGERALHAMFRSPVYPLMDDHTHWRTRQEGRDELVGVFTERLIPRQNSPWEELSSDAAQSAFAFSGLGAFHLRRLAEPDSEGSHFVVDVTSMARHPVRTGFERYGAAAYFDADRQIVKIFWSHVGHDIRPGDPDWPHAKFAWRSSVFVGLTVSDHLWGLHLRLGNDMVNATRETLGTEHPIRLLLKPYCFRTVAINHRGANVLVVERGLPHRAFGLTYKGFLALLLDGDAEALLRPFPEVLALRGTADLPDFPFGEDGQALYAVFHGFVSAYVDLYFPDSNAIVSDPALSLWWDALSGIRVDDAPLLHRAQVVDVLTAFLFSVAALHEHMGALSEYLVDPTFVGGRMVPGAVMNDVQSTVLSMLLMSGSGLSQPPLMADFSHLLPHQKSAEVLVLYQGFRSSLAALSAQIGVRNASRARGYESMNPSFLKCSVSI